MRKDQLYTNEALAIGNSKISNNKQLRLTLQKNGDLQLIRERDSHVLWATGTAGQGADRLFMNWDGDLRLQRPDNSIVWSSHTGGHKDAFAIVQDDGNFVVYKDHKKSSGTDVWASGTYLFSQGDLHGKMGSLYHRPNAGQWAGNAIKTAGRDIGTVTHAIQDEAGKIGKELSKVPVVGGLLHGIFDASFMGMFGPMLITNQVIIGERIDKVVLKNFQDQLRDFKEVGPYAQMVVSFIPGIGTGISAAIGAGLALANGQPITDVFLAGIKGALPGGPLARMAFDMAQSTIESAVKHEKIDIAHLADAGVGAVVSAVGMPDIAKQALIGGLHAATALASGQRVDRALVGGFSDMLPIPDTAKKAIGTALDIGVSLAEGQKIDKVLASHLKDVVNLLPVGGDIKKSLIVAADSGSALIQGQPINKVISDTLQHTVTDILLDHAKQALPPDAQKALNIGIAVAKGRVNQIITAPQLTGPVLNKVMSIGQNLVKSDAIVGQARSLLSDGKKGFDVAAGLMRQVVNQHQFLTIRQALSDTDKKGFDMAVSLHVARVANPTPAHTDINMRIGYLTTLGMQGAFPNQKTAMMAVLADHPIAKAGAVDAVKEIANAREGFWHKVFRTIGLIK